MAAEQREVEAQTALGLMYLDGEGVPQDEREAVKWIRRAAEEGSTDAQALLGGMYYLGKGVPKNYVAAYAWLSVAVAQGDDNAREGRELVISHLTAAQVDQGEELASSLLRQIVEGDQ